MSNRNDIYPTRTREAARILERQDPVVYGEVPPDTLTPERVEQYERDGYLFCPDFFAPGEVARLRAELDQLAGDEALKARDITITEPASGDVRSIFTVHEISEVFSLLARERRLLDIVRRLLGSEVYVHQSRVNCKPGYTGKEFYWHSDFETWHAEDGMPRMRAISCSISLTDNYSFNGPLMVVPGSHKQFVQCQGVTPEDNFKSSLKKQEIGVPSHDHLRALVDTGGIAMPTGKAGSVLFFECNLMHGSNSNITPYPRSNVFFVFNSIENTLEPPFAAAKPRPAFLASRDFTPLVPSDFGGGVASQPAPDPAGATGARG